MRSAANIMRQSTEQTSEKTDPGSAMNDPITSLQTPGETATVASYKLVVTVSLWSNQRLVY